MAYFSEDMSSGKARNTFFGFYNEYINDNISLEEIRDVIKEYKEVSEKIMEREIKEFKKELAIDTYLLMEETLE